MLDISPFTDEQWQTMCDHMDFPFPLSKKTLTDSFVYDRKWGVFPVNFGHHVFAMANLLAFHHGFGDYFDYAEANSIENNYNLVHTLADKYLIETPGTFFASSCGSKLTAGKRSNLNALERRAISDYTVYYLEDSEDG